AHELRLDAHAPVAEAVHGDRPEARLEKVSVMRAEVLAQELEEAGIIGVLVRVAAGDFGCVLQVRDFEHAHSFTAFGSCASQTKRPCRQSYPSRDVVSRHGAVNRRRDGSLWSGAV